jgi:hypothetical protein
MFIDQSCNTCPNQPISLFETWGQYFNKDLAIGLVCVAEEYIVYIIQIDPLRFYTEKTLH